MATGHGRRRTAPGQATVDLAAYGVTAAFCSLATRQTSTVQSRNLCAVLAAVFGVGAAAAWWGGPAYARRRAVIAVIMRLLFALLHNTIVWTNRFYKMAVPIRSWPAFFMARTGPLMFGVLNLSAGFRRGQGLAALLAAEWLLLAVSQRDACATQAGWTLDNAFFYNRVVDVVDRVSALGWAAVLGGGGGSNGGGGSSCGGGGQLDKATAAPALARPALDTCTIHSCRLVLGAMYAIGAVASYQAAPRVLGRSHAEDQPPVQRTRLARLEAASAASLTAVFFAGVAWTVAAAVLPRPAWCPGTAAAVGWAALRAGGG